MKAMRAGPPRRVVCVSDSETIRNHAAFVWQVADLLRGDYKQSEYGKVILPMVVLRRLDCVLEPTKEAVLARHEALKGAGIENVEPVLCAVSGEQFYNVSKLDLPRLLDDPANIADNLLGYLQGFSLGAREVLDRFDFAVQVERLNRAKLLYLVVSKFCEIDLHPATVSNLEMGYLYEELIRRFSELSNETAGEHFTPREVIRLMVKVSPPLRACRSVNPSKRSSVRIATGVKCAAACSSPGQANYEQAGGAELLRRRMRAT